MEIGLLYAELDSAKRINKIFSNNIRAGLSGYGFEYLKEKKRFVKHNDWFDFHLIYYNNKNNEKTITVEFDLSLAVFSPKYREWELNTYKLNNLDSNSIIGKRVEYIDNWDKKNYSGWYDLVNFDNNEIVELILNNFKNAGLNFFNNFKSLDSAISFLSKDSIIANFETIIDFYILMDKLDEAKDFFEKYSNHFEIMILEHDEYFLLNGKDKYLKRKSILK